MLTPYDIWLRLKIVQNTKYKRLTVDQLSLLFAFSILFLTLTLNLTLLPLVISFVLFGFNGVPEASPSPSPPFIERH